MNYVELFTKIHFKYFMQSTQNMSLHPTVFIKIYFIFIFFESAFPPVFFMYHVAAGGM